MESIRVCTYNVHNLFDGGSGKSESEWKALAGILNRVAGDVVALQEVGSAAVLNTLNRRLKDPYAHEGFIQSNSDRGIHLGVLSRYPLTLRSHKECILTSPDGEILAEFASEADAVENRSSPLRFQRDLLLAEWMAGPVAFAAFVVHLKSKTNQPWRALSADEVRSAEGRALARIVSAYVAQNPLRNTLLLGDFNDTLNSDALSTVRDLGFIDPVGAELAGTGRNPSTYWPKRRTRIDLLLVEPALRRRILAGSGKIHASQMAQRASDHYPVSLQLRID